MVNRLDVDGGDVIRQQHNFIGVDLVPVLVGQLLRRNQPALQQAGDECARAGERVDDVDVLIPQRLPEFALQHVIDAVQDEIHHLDRRVHDPQPFGHAREGVTEKLVVQLHHDLLLARRVVDALRPQLHAVIERLQGVRLLVQAVGLQLVQHLLHGFGHGVMLGEAVILEQGFKHRLGDQVLRQHFDNLGVGDGVVEVVTQLPGKGIKGGDFGSIGRGVKNGLDAGNVGAGNLGNVIRPIFPVAAVADLFHDLGIDGALDFVHLQRHFHLWVIRAASAGFLVLLAQLKLTFACVFLGGLFGFFGDLVSNGDDFHFAGVRAIQIQLVDHRIKAVIVGTQRVQHLPHHLVGLVVFQRRVWLHPGRDHHWQDDVTALLALGLAHDPPHRLHYVYLRIARGQEQHCIQRRDIHPFGQTTHVGENPAGVVWRLGLQPVELFLFLAGIHAAVHMLGLAVQSNRDSILRHGAAVLRLLLAFMFLIGFHHRLEHGGYVLGADLVVFRVLGWLDHLAEGHGAAHECLIIHQVLAGSLLGQGFPATYDLGGIVHLELVVVVLEQGLQAAADVRLVYRQHQHLVIDQQIILDRLREGNHVQVFAIPCFVIHRVQRHVVTLGGGLGAVGIDARGGGHVQALAALDKGSIVDFHKAGIVFVLIGCPGGAVRLIANDQVKACQPVFLLRFADHLNGMVGGEHHAHVLAIVALAHLRRQPCRVGGGRVTQLVGKGLHNVIVFFALVAHVAIGTDREAVQWGRAFLCPLGQGLRQQRQTRHQEQYALAAACQRFGDFQAGEGLARAASHDQLAPVGGLQATLYPCQRLALVLPELLLGLEYRRLARLVLAPINLAVFEVVEVNLVDWRLLVTQRVVSVFTPVVGGDDDQPVTERLFAGSGKEAVDVAFLDAVIRRVELALDGVDLVGSLCLRHQVYAGIPRIQALLTCPISIRPYLAVQIPVSRLIAQVGTNQVFKVRAFLAVGLGCFAVGGE